MQKALKNLKVTYLPLTIIFYLEWLFPHQIQVYRWTREPEVSVWCGACSCPHLAEAAAVQTFTSPLRWMLHLPLYSTIHEGLGRDPWLAVAPLTLFSISLMLKLRSTLLGLDYERQVGYQLIRKCICFPLFFLAGISDAFWNFPFPFGLASLSKQPPWGGWYNLMTSGPGVVKVKASQRLCRISAVSLVRRLLFVCSLSCFWVITWWISF